MSDKPEVLIMNDAARKRMEQLENLLAQAHAIIEIKPRKVVYANAPKAWCKQFKALGIPELVAEREEKPIFVNCGSTDVIGRFTLVGYNCGKDECLPF